MHIVGFTESAKYNASPVIFTNDATIAKINPRLTGDKINAVVVRDTNWKDKKLNQELEAVSINDFIENLPGYKPQNLTLNFMISFLFVISATVIGIFLYVMTLQNKFIWHIKGSRIYEWLFSERSYFADAHISIIWYGIWLTVNRRYRCILPDAVPVKFDVLTLLVFAIVLMIVSVLGSLFSILTIRKIDPLKAIG